mgnify:CR=1 FL=1
MREKRFKSLVCVKFARITPACAGKTCYCGRSNGTLQDHPRVCGKNFLNVFEIALGSGSPPRVREKPLEAGAVPDVAGITPACAGKTILNERLCRESSGSPPRVREKLSWFNLTYFFVRITPACAGKTSFQ